MAKLPAYPTDEKPGINTGLPTITGPALMQLELPEPPAVVPGFFVEGLTLLASRPKLGKSWLMLNTAVAVTSGNRALGKIQAEKGEALYLGLEDNERRLQSRLEVITDAVPEGLHLATSGAMSRLYEGGLEQLSDWLTAHPACRLVVIDTLARIRPRRRPGADLYEEDAALGAQLQALASKHRISLVMVHHVRKALADDFLDTVSGSTGLTGVVDAVLVLTRQRGEADAVLHVTGRDIEEASHALQFDPHRGLWSLLGDAAVYALTKERQTILAYLTLRMEPASPKEVAEGTGLPRGSTRNMLAKLRDEGRVRCPERGLYISSSNSDDSGDSTRERAHSTAQTPVIAPVTGKQEAMTDDSARYQPTEAMTAPMTGVTAVQESTNPLPVIAVTAVAKGMPPEVQELYHRWKSGEFKTKGASISQGEFHAGQAHREIEWRFDALKRGKQTEHNKVLKTLLEIAQAGLHEHYIDDLRHRLDAGEFSGTSGTFGGIHFGNLEPALRRALRSADTGNRESAAKLEHFMEAFREAP